MMEGLLDSTTVDLRCSWAGGLSPRELDATRMNCKTELLAEPPRRNLGTLVHYVILPSIHR